MALATQGFALSALDRAPDIPENVGKIDVKSIYDRVAQGLNTAEALRTTLARQQVADAELKAAAQAAPLNTAILASQADQAPIQTALLTDRAQLSHGVLPGQLVEAGNALGDQRFLSGLTPAQRLVLAKFGPATNTESVSVRKPTGQVLSRSSETANIGGESIPVSAASSEAPFITSKNIPASLVEFEQMTANLTPAERAVAEKMNLGLLAKAHEFAPKSVTAKLKDGSTAELVFNPNTRQYEIPQISGTVVAPASGAAAPAPLTLKDNPLTSSTSAELKGAETTAAETAKLQAERQQKLPKAQQALKLLDDQTANLETTIDKAINLIGPTSTGFGSLLNGVPTTDARALKALLTTIRARMGFGELQEMRNNSPTGGALGAVSDNENVRLDSATAALDQGLDAAGLKESLETVRAVRRQALQRIRQAYDQDFSLAGNAGTPKTGAQTAPAAADQEAVSWARAHSNDPRAKAIFQANGLSN